MGKPLKTRPPKQKILFSINPSPTLRRERGIYLFMKRFMKRFSYNSRLRQMITQPMTDDYPNYDR